MAINMINALFDRKVKRIVDYMFIIFENVQIRRPEEKKIYKKCVRSFFEDFYFKDINVSSKLSDDIIDFIEDNKIKNKEKVEVLYELFEHMIYFEKIKDKPIYIDSTLVLSDVMLLMIKLDELTDPAFGKDMSYDLALKKLKTDYSKVIDNNLNFIFEKENKFLRNKVNENIELADKVTSIYKMKDNPFNPSYYLINENATENHLVYCNMDYVIKNEKLYNKKEVNDILLRSDCGIDYANAKLEILGTDILYNLMNNNNKELYFIDMPIKFFDKKLNFNKLIDIMSIDFIRERVYFVIGYEQFKKNLKRIEELISTNGINVAVSDINGNDSDIRIVKKYTKYILTNYNIDNNIESVKDFARVNKINLIIKNKENTFDFIPINSYNDEDQVIVIKDEDE